MYIEGALMSKSCNIALRKGELAPSYRCDKITINSVEGVRQLCRMSSRKAAWDFEFVTLFDCLAPSAELT